MFAAWSSIRKYLFTDLSILQIQRIADLSCNISFVRVVDFLCYT